MIARVSTQGQSARSRRMGWRLMTACTLGLAVAPSVALGQRPLNQVLDLNRQAMESYTNLEIAEAEAALQQALQVARQNGLSGAPVARTFLNLGVVAIGGMGDNAAGLDYFVQAIAIDPSAQLDPLTSTPDIQTVFNLARQRAAGGGFPATTPTTPTPTTQPIHTPERPRLPAGSTIPHEPVPEQLAQTAVPVFVEVPENAPVGSIRLYYKSLGMRDYRLVDMQRIPGGFGYEIPCAEVFQPSVSYYIVAVDEQGATMGFAGSAEDPVVIPIVATRSYPPAALPGRQPPETCREGECPPGMAGCHAEGGPAGLGETCGTSAECSEGLRCEDDFCVTFSAGDDETPFPDVDVPRFFLQLGGTLGAAYAREGMPADGGPPTGTPAEDSPWVLDDGSSCDPDNDGQAQGGTGDLRYCVGVDAPGFVPIYAATVTAGYYITSRVGAAAWLRYAPSHGTSPMAGMIIGVRGQFLLNRPNEVGVNAALFFGSSYGQIQVQVPQESSVAAPYALAGLNGGQFGAALSYRFTRNFGVQLTPQVHVLLPIFLLAIDMSGGLELAF